MKGTAGAVGNELPEDSDQLLQSLRRGEPRAFELLAARHAPHLVRLSHRLLGWSANGAAQDVVQDVLVRMMEKPQRIAATGGSLESWLITVTVNQCRTQQRNWLNRLRLLRRLPVTESAAAESDDETRRQVRQAVKRLPPRDREVIVLHYLEEIAVPDIAAMLNLKPNAVEVRLHRARARLKTELEFLVKE